MKTKRALVNPDKIHSILMDIIKQTYEQVKGEEVLLCLDCLDVDLKLATTNLDEFSDAIRENFELDENFEIIDYDGYKELMDELNENFILLHSTTGLFDYFPPGEYTVNGETRYQESDYLAPKDVFYAPFEDAVNK
jgi:superfamily I DNA/RNA helicase